MLLGITAHSEYPQWLYVAGDAVVGGTLHSSTIICINIALRGEVNAQQPLELPPCKLADIPGIFFGEYL